MVLTYYLRTYIYKPNYEIIKYFFYSIIFRKLFGRKNHLYNTYLIYDENNDMYK